jgi:transposase-like protein
MRTKFDEETESLIVYRYNQGISAVDLAVFHGCCTQTIVNILNRHSVRRIGNHGKHVAYKCASCGSTNIVETELM